MISQLLLSILVNACWQIALLTAFATICHYLLRRAPAPYRHWLWVITLTACFCLPIFTSLSSFAGELLPTKATPETTTSVPVTLQIEEPKPTNVLAPAITVADYADSFIRINTSAAILVFTLYLIFFAYRSLRLLRAWGRTTIIRQSAYAIDLPEQMQNVLAACQQAISVQNARILFSRSLTLPITIGSREPCIMLPDSWLRENDENLLTAAIGHELVHILRRDYAFNLFYELLYLPLAFHPAAALVRRRINETRELRCDEFVTEKVQDTKTYARSLVQLAGSSVGFNRPTPIISVGIADADNLEVRIMSLLRKSTLSASRKRLLLIAALLLLALPCGVAAAFALRVGTPSTNAATIGQEPSEREKRELKERKERLSLEEHKAREERESQDPEIQAKRRLERELKAKIQHELAKQARVTIEQAIQIAKNQQPGTVMECRLVGEHNMVFYFLTIVSGEDTENNTYHVQVNALDGQVIKVWKEERD